jgi:uncharacterized coiled-coil DUF342 family protein
MGIASEMKELTRNIASSHEDRIKKIGEIRQEANEARGEARNLIKGFEASRKELKAELKEASAAWQGLTAAKAKTK